MGYNTNGSNVTVARTSESTFSHPCILSAWCGRSVCSGCACVYHQCACLLQPVNSHHCI